ncbi:hypothetical protein RJ641_013731 [Dillenia turbinata]|uniref:Plastid division protein PDV2 n=1 Tax=Dillenia turbinata TaxID=194707 RepID=A0AAN8ZQT3_9MAGN
MEDDGIGIVLCRASELRSKIANCIGKASSLYREGKGVDEEEQEEREDRSSSLSQSPTETVVEVSEPDEEAESLVHIRDALESLESQLSSLQALQQQQQYEREAALADIDYSRRMLLEKLKDYKGKDLEVINEASAFASEAVEHNSDLLLPPYLSRPHSLVLDNGYVSRFPSTQMFVRNGVSGVELSNEAKKSINKSDKTQTESLSTSSQNGLIYFLGVAAKAVIAFAGVVSILSLAGFEPKLGKHTTRIVMGPLRRSGTEEKRSTPRCPPGKVLVMEDGEARCLVKERVEIPFEPVVTKPDVNYGFG